MSTDTHRRRYVDAADVAKMLRQRLKTEYPATKFSVRTDRYSGGSSVDIRWTDGPCEAEVDRFARNYSGGHFDGMTDSYTHSDSVILDENGVDAFRSGAQYVQTQRRISDEWTAELENEVAKATGEPFDSNKHYAISVYFDFDDDGIKRTGGLARDDHRGEYGMHLVSQLAWGRNRC